MAVRQDKSITPAATGPYGPSPRPGPYRPLGPYRP